MNAAIATRSTSDVLASFGLLWSVNKRPLLVDVSIPGWSDARKLTSHAALVRSDSGTVLDVVGSGYQVLQNEDLVQMVQALCRDGQFPDDLRGGSFRDGADIWLQGNVAEVAVDAKGDDIVLDQVLFANSHGKRAATINPCSTRVKCKNTFVKALSEGEWKVSYRHTSSLPERLEAAVEILAAVGVEQGLLFAKFRKLAETTFGPNDRRAWFRKAWELIHGRAAPATFDRKVDDLICKWEFNAMDNDDNVVDSTRGTAWAALQGITYWADHERKSTDRQFSNLLGTSSETKQRLLKSIVSFLEEGGE